MPQALNSPAQLDVRRHDWIARVGRLVAEIAEWSKAEGWEVEHHPKTIREELLGQYEVPALAIRLPAGEITVNPIALHVIGADGRIDLEALPTLSRVKLLGVPAGWQVMTDSNVPLRDAWNQETFVRLVHDLLR